MDTTPTGQPVDSYEQRDELALRSAAGDPTVESRPTSSHKSPGHTEQTLGGKVGATLTTSRDSAHVGRYTPSHFQKNSVESGQSLAKEPSKPNKPKETQLNTKTVQASQAIFDSLPDLILRRNELFDRLKRERNAELLAKEKPQISVVLDLGLDKEGKPRPEVPVAAKAWESTPGSFLRHVDKDISSDVVVAKVNGDQLWDLDRPLEYACRISYVPFSSAEGRNVFWHSSAHVLGEAAECQFNCLLSHGPPVEQGFFYDMAISDGFVTSVRIQETD